MARKRILRQVQTTPLVKGFRPYGRLEGKRRQVVLALDEYEAIRLLDHELLTQAEAAELMQVSRPTLTRIYNRARRKFASALVEGAQILIEGGDVRLKEHSFWCEDCDSFSQSEEKYVFHCPDCEGPNLVSLKDCHEQQCKKCGRCRHGGRNARF